MPRFAFLMILAIIDQAISHNIAIKGKFNTLQKLKLETLHQGGL